MNDELKRLYYDPKTGFGSATHLYRAAVRAKVPGVKVNDCVAFIKKQETAQIHKGTNEKREKQQYHIESKRGYWQVDHTFMKHKKINNGHKAIFVAVDIGSRFVYAKAMKNIRADAVIETFEAFLKTVKQKNIKGIVNDEGSEFTSGSLKDWLQDHSIHQRTLHPTYHYYSNALVERFNGVLKNKLNKYMTSHGTKKWVDALDDIVYNNNRSIHSTTHHRPKDMLKSPLKQLIFRLKTMNKNHNLRTKKDFVINKITKGSRIRIRRIPKTPFDKSYVKFNKKEHVVESFSNGGVMVGVEGMSRKLRPFEILPVGDLETNPLKRNTKSHDVENALDAARKVRKNGRRVKRIRSDALVREIAKNRSKPVRKDYKDRGVSFELNGERMEGRVKRMGDWDNGMFVEYIVNGKRYEERMTVDDVTLLDSAPKLNLVKTKRVVIRKELEQVDAATEAMIKLVSTNSVLVVKTDGGGDKFWLAKPVGKARRAVVQDEGRSKGMVQRGKWIVTIKWYETAGTTRTYSLVKGNNYLNLSSVYEIEGVELDADGKGDTVYTLSARDRSRILKAVRDEKAHTVVEKEQTETEKKLTDQPPSPPAQPRRATRFNRGGAQEVVGMSKAVRSIQSKLKRALAVLKNT